MLAETQSTKAQREQSLWARSFRPGQQRVVLLAESDDAEGAASVIVVAGGEEELIGIAVGASTPLWPNWMAQMSSISMGFPVASRSGPRKAPDLGSNALMRPREVLLVISSALRMGPKSEAETPIGFGCAREAWQWWFCLGFSPWLRNFSIGPT
jgi:hypothetical protein